jgi:hypothetical protein
MTSGKPVSATSQQRSPERGLHSDWPSAYVGEGPPGKVSSFSGSAAQPLPLYAGQQMGVAGAAAVVPAIQSPPSNLPWGIPPAVAAAAAAAAALNPLSAPPPPPGYALLPVARAPIPRDETLFAAAAEFLPFPPLPPPAVRPHLAELPLYSQRAGRPAGPARSGPGSQARRRAESGTPSAACGPPPPPMPPPPAPPTPPFGRGRAAASAAGAETGAEVATAAAAAAASDSDTDRRIVAALSAFLRGRDWVELTTPRQISEARYPCRRDGSIGRSGLYGHPPPNLINHHF